jgi:hypothetical protein
VAYFLAILPALPLPGDYSHDGHIDAADASSDV